MAEFLYTPSPKNVTDFFNKMESIGIPQTKVTRNSIKQYGFTSSNDRYLIGVLKSLGFLSADNLPAERWQDYRSKSNRAFVMAQAIREAYSGLFKTYEDANKRDDEALRDYFRANTKVGDKTVELMLNTFKNLCALADFEAVPAEIAAPEAPVSDKERVIHIPAETPPGLTVNINVQLTLPATDDESVYDKLFSSLKNNLLS